MLLALDIGNTQTSFGVFKGSSLLHHWRAETLPSRTSDEYASFLFPLLRHVGLENVSWEGAIICSVVPPAEYTFELFARDYLKVSAKRVHAGLKLGFKVNLTSPGEVGADRLANAAYAVKCLKLPAVVVDFGTATTFDVIGTDGNYQGGMILPGVRMGLQGLSAKTSKLPLVDVDFPTTAIGKNTVDCIRSGVLLGYVDMVNGLLKRLEKEIGQVSDVAFTGGLSSLFQKNTFREVKLLPNLTLEGTEILYRQNWP